MGVQITIERDVLEAAGWQCHVEDDFYTEQDDEGNDISKNYPVLVIEKGIYTFYSYCGDCFSADCNDWGCNKARFIEAGLFYLEHCLG